LIDDDTGLDIDPIATISDGKVEMTVWEKGRSASSKTPIVVAVETTADG
jgi:hypothetical protein